MFEGSRAFDIGWGTVAGTLCFALGFYALRLWLDARASGDASLVGRATDPGRSLHLAWAIFALAMGGTNFGCRYVEHRYLAGVHEGFFVLTVLVFAVLLPNMLKAAQTHRLQYREAGALAPPTVP